MMPATSFYALEMGMFMYIYAEELGKLYSVNICWEVMIILETLEWVWNFPQVICLELLISGNYRGDTQTRWVGLNCPHISHLLKRSFGFLFKFCLNIE